MIVFQWNHICNSIFLNMYLERLLDGNVHVFTHAVSIVYVAHTIKFEVRYKYV